MCIGGINPNRFEPDVDALAFVIAFFLGRVISILLYQSTWKNGIARKFHPWGALATFLARPWPWLAHIPIVVLTASLDWQSLPHVRVFIWVAAGALCLGAVGRFGAVDLGRFFLFDRCLIVLLWVGLGFSPAFLYPLLLACCCLQYTVSGWALNPGYSNLLGFEFMRSSLCMALAGLLTLAGLSGIDAAPMGIVEAEALFFALVLCGQAAGYVQQAVAKSALGKHWYSWFRENRLQCLLVNAYLRGWCAQWIRMESILRLARWVTHFRVPLCAAACLIEISWLFILADSPLALMILAATLAFHLAVWLFTGLAGYHYAISHLLMIFLYVTISSQSSKSDYALVGGGCILVSSVWVLLLRRHIFREYTRHGAPGGWGWAADPADHLMSWWDGPYMRMYSYRVKTVTGRHYDFPVTRFSPYDTFMTDMHTHLMILNRNWDLDPQLAADRVIARTGVWGLSVSLQDRDPLYRLMDSPEADLGCMYPKTNDSRISDSFAPLVAFFQGIHRFQSRWWFRILFRWPHFPGEDHVPDISPLASESLPAYSGTEPVTEVICTCVKTFYRGDAILKLDESVFARICIPQEASK